ncbi:MAG: ABC transporter permease subunit [Lachnospiraceae bacterium]|nr:ABC transporter permease subunit [Lachnospiraceae bacterium]
MKKTVIGLNLKYFKVAFFASVLSLLSLVLPFISVGGQNLQSVGVLTKLVSAGQSGGMTIVLLVSIVATIGVILFAVINFIKPSVLMARMWVAVAAVQTVCTVILMFGTKMMVDGSGILAEAFLVKNFGIGYWIGLVVSFVGLIFAMKTTKMNPGYIVLVIMSVIWLFPILWIVLTSFREEQGYYVGYFIPKGFTLNNYLELFSAESVIPFARWWTNTFIVAIICCVLNTIIILATAYVLSRTRFGGRVTIMKIMMIIGMFPGFMSMIAVYNILKGMGLAQTLLALIVIGVAGAAMGYQVCKGFFDTMPKSLDEAAIIDGATRFQIFTRIIVPLAKPMIIYTMLTSFLGPWSDYIFPSMLFGDKQASYTVAVGLKWMTDFRRIDAYYTQFAAGSILVAVPIVILFIFLQKYYVEGLSGAVKG